MTQHLSSTPDPAELLRERRWLVGFATALVGPSDAEDLAQETLVVALRRRGAALHPRPWLRAVARHLAANRRRSDSARTRRERSVAPPETAPELDASTLAERTEAQQRVVEALLTLDEPYRETLLLRYPGELSAAAIAARLGCTEGTVRRRVSLGLEQLRRRLDRESGGRRGWAAALVPGTVAGRSLPALTGALLVNWKALFGAVALCALVSLVGLQLLRTHGPSTPASGVAAGADLQLAGTDPAGAIPAVPKRGARTPPTEAEAGTRLSILNALGAPVHVTRATLLKPGQTVELDADRLETDWRGPAMLLVRADGRWPFAIDVDLQPGDQELRAPQGVELPISVRVPDGTQPGPFELVLARDVPRDGFFGLDLERAGWSAEDLKLGFEVVSGEAFVVQGLPPSWRGWISAPAGFRFRAWGSAERPLDLELEAGRPLELELVPRLRVSGRFVDRDTGAPAGAVVANLWVQAEDGRETSLGFEAGADGAFDLAVHADTAYRVGVDCSFGSFSLAEPVQRESLGGSSSIDLGTLAVIPPVRRQLQLVGAGGEPVEGATLGVGSGTAEPAEDPGVWDLRLPPASVEVTLVAWSAHHAKRQATVGLEDGVLRLELEPGAALELRANGVDGSPRERATLYAEFDDFPDGRVPDIQTEGANAWWRRDGRVERLAAWTNADGVALIPGLPAGVRGRCWEGEEEAPESAKIPFGPLPAGRTTTIELTVAGRLVRLGGEVRDDSGRPLARAEVSLNRPGDRRGRLASTRTDDHGRYVLFVPPYGEALELQARASGFAPRSEALPVGLLSDLHQDLRLQEGRSVHLRIMDAEGRPQPAEVVRARRLPKQAEMEYGSLDVAGRGCSEALLRGLVDPELEWIARVGGVERRLRHRTDEQEVRLVVPSSGSLQVEYDAVESDDSVGHLHLVLRDPEEPTRWIELSVRPDLGGTREFSAVAPGTWELELAADFNPDAPSERYETLAGPRTVEVWAGRRTEISLRGSR